jgi:hypothetical protein
MTTRKRPCALVGLAAALAATLSTALATATGAVASTAVAFNTSWHGQLAHGLLPDRVDCTTNLGVCELYFSGNLSHSGSFVGTSHIVLHGHFTLTGTFAFVAHSQVSGTLAGCGSGTFRDTDHGALSSIVPRQLSFGAQGDTTVDPGSGTGALTGLTGSGIDTPVVSPTGAVSGRGVGTGYCEHSDRHRRHHNPHHPRHRSR